MTTDPCRDCQALATRGALLAAWAPVVHAAGKLRDDRSPEAVEAVIAAFERIPPTIRAAEKRNRSAPLSLSPK